MYQDKLSELRTIIETILSIEIINYETIKLLVESINPQIDNYQNTIFDCMDNIFNDRSFSNGDNINNIKLNAYTDYFKEYNPKTKSYTNIIDYPNGRGLILDISKQINDGLYIETDKTFFNSLLSLSNQYQIEFESFIPPIIETPITILTEDESTEPTVPSKEEQFWNDSDRLNIYTSYINSIKTQLSARINLLNGIKSKILNFYSFGLDMITTISIAQSLINSENKTVDETETSLLEKYNDIKTVIKIFDSKLESGVEIYTNLKETYPDISQGELSKKLKKEVIEKNNYQETSVELINSIEESKNALV